MELCRTLKEVREHPIAHQFYAEYQLSTSHPVSADAALTPEHFDRVVDVLKSRVPELTREKDPLSVAVFHVRDLVRRELVEHMHSQYPDLPADVLQRVSRVVRLASVEQVLRWSIDTRPLAFEKKRSFHGPASFTPEQTYWRDQFSWLPHNEQGFLCKEQLGLISREYLVQQLEVNQMTAPVSAGSMTARDLWKFLHASKEVLMGYARPAPAQQSSDVSET